jgi:hypothetical protein
MAQKHEPLSGPVTPANLDSWSFSSSVGLLAVIIVIAVVVIAIFVCRKNQPPQAKYTYHQIPVDSRLNAPGPPISELSWSAEGPDKVHIGGLDSEDELDKRESVAT